MRFLKLALSAALALSGVSRAGAQPAGAPSPAAASAEQWLGLIDQGRYPESWDQAGATLKSHFGKADWEKLVEPVRSPLGAFASRNLKSETPTRPWPGVPDGNYERLEFDTHFAGSHEVTETVFLTREPTGWKVDGYSIAAIDPLYLPYESPGILANIPGGPTINIKCMGTGSPTVVLTAGKGDWAASWRTIQPEIARTTRVCAWDRPGFGFSSGSAQPQTVLNTTADLEAALRIADIRGPYIIVGHSLGGYESLLFKDRNPQTVVGMVLIDPSIPDQVERLGKAAPDVGKFYEPMTARLTAQIERCIASLKSGRLTIDSPDPESCLYYPPVFPPDLRRTLASRDTDPLRLVAVQSLTDNFARDASIVVSPTRNYGDMPLIVLSATKDPGIPGMPQSAKDELPAEHAALVRGHDELAALSSRGVNRLVADSNHYVQYDQPKAVIDAIQEVIRAARSKPGGGQVAPRN